MADKELDIKQIAIDSIAKTAGTTNNSEWDGEEKFRYENRENLHEKGKEVNKESSINDFSEKVSRLKETAKELNNQTLLYKTIAIEAKYLQDKKQLTKEQKAAVNLIIQSLQEYYNLTNDKKETIKEDPGEILDKYETKWEVEETQKSEQEKTKLDEEAEKIRDNAYEEMKKQNPEQKEIIDKLVETEKIIDKSTDLRQNFTELFNKLYDLEYQLEKYQNSLEENNTQHKEFIMKRIKTKQESLSQISKSISKKIKEQIDKIDEEIQNL